MFVITVIPLKRGITIDTLSYFGTEQYVPGTVVSIPIRDSSTLGLVTESQEVSAAKAALRAATFSLRKLPLQNQVALLSRAYIQTAEELSLLYASSMGVILYNLLPPEIRNGEIPLPHTHHISEAKSIPPQTLLAHRNDRFVAYRSLVRETFAHSGSVLMVAPSSVEAENLKKMLEQGIQDRIIMLTTALSKSELRRAYSALEDFSKTKLIIATPSHSMIERHDITLVIMESAHSSYYKELTRPYIDYRDALSVHAKYAGRRIIFADILLRTEEEYKRREEEYHTYGETPKRVELPGKLQIIEMKQEEGIAMPFRLFSSEVIQAIKDARKKKGRIFLFAARRGLAPLVGCSDCGYIFRSKESGAPYSLVRTHKGGLEERWFACSTSGERIRAADTCSACGSWRLRERGIGIQQVYDELHKLFPTTPTILFDHITARSYKRASFLRDAFYQSKGSILLGTHMAIPYLTKTVDLSVVVNMDALLSTPTWRLEEENLALLLRLREETNGAVLVQTRSKENTVLSFAKHGTVEHFYNEEIALRKSFNYPPFSTFIHLTWQGNPDTVGKLEKEFAEIFKDFGISIYQSPTSAYENPLMYALMRIPAGEWPNKKLVMLLRSIPPSVRVVINPDKIV
jgi:primosomal protein N'